MKYFAQNKYKLLLAFIPAFILFFMILVHLFNGFNTLQTYIIFSILFIILFLVIYAFIATYAFLFRRLHFFPSTEKNQQSSLKQRVILWIALAILSLVVGFLVYILRTTYVFFFDTTLPAITLPPIQSKG